MARSFNSTTPDYFTTNSAVITGTPFTYAAWVNLTSVTTSQQVMTIVNNAVETDKFQLYISNTGLGAFQARSVAAGTPQAVTSGALSANTWHHVGATSVSASSRYAYLDGVQGTQNTVHCIPQGLNFTAIGMDRDSTPGNPLNGLIAEVAIWNEALSSVEMSALSRGVSPMAVRRSALVAYWPLWGIDSPEPSVISGSFSMSATGSPSRGNHAPVGLFSRNTRRMPESGEAPASSSASQHYYQRLMR